MAVSVCLPTRVELAVGESVLPGVAGVSWEPPPRLNGRLVHPTIAIRSINDKNRTDLVSIKAHGTA
jgi:hypothetical protein